MPIEKFYDRDLKSYDMAEQSEEAEKALTKARTRVSTTPEADKGSLGLRPLVHPFKYSSEKMNRRWAEEGLQRAERNFEKFKKVLAENIEDRKSTRLNSSHSAKSRMPSSA